MNVEQAARDLAAANNLSLEEAKEVVRQGVESEIRGMEKLTAWFNWLAENMPPGKWRR